jgi:lysophospholipase
MVGFDINSTKQQLGPFSWQAPTVYAPAVQAYCEFYGINFAVTLDCQHQLGYFPIADQRILLQWLQAKKSKGLFFILHGLYEHAGLYKYLINYLLTKGYSVVIWDWPDHGLSSGERASITSFVQYRQVLEAIIQLFQPRIGYLPWYLIGHSTGAAVAMDYLLSQSSITNASQVFQQQIWLAPLVQPYGWRYLRYLHALLKPWFKRLKRPSPNHCHDPVFLDFLWRQDPLQTKHLSLTWVNAMVAWIERLKSSPATHLAPLIIQGDQDRTLDWRYNIALVKTKFTGAKVIYLSGAKHALVHEPEPYRQQIYQYIDQLIAANSFTSEQVNLIDKSHGQLPGLV